MWFGDREMQTFRERTYTQNNSFMNYQQIYSFNQWNDWEEHTFFSTLPENNLKICYRLQNIASLVTERTQLPHPKKFFPLSSPFYRMWRHFSLDDHNTKNVPGVVECSPPPLVIAHNIKDCKENCGHVTLAAKGPIIVNMPQRPTYIHMAVTKANAHYLLSSL